MEHVTVTQSFYQCLYLVAPVKVQPLTLGEQTHSQHLDNTHVVNLFTTNLLDNIRTNLVDNIRTNLVDIKHRLFFKYKMIKTIIYTVKSFYFMPKLISEELHSLLVTCVSFLIRLQ